MPLTLRRGANEVIDTDLAIDADVILPMTLMPRAPEAPTFRSVVPLEEGQQADLHGEDGQIQDHGFPEWFTHIVAHFDGYHYYECRSQFHKGVNTQHSIPFRDT